MIYAPFAIAKNESFRLFWSDKEFKPRIAENTKRVRASKNFFSLRGRVNPATGLLINLPR
jgi:hypothetical protein